jgi:hypothetical protein
MQVDVIEGDIRALVNEVVPEGRLNLVDVLDQYILGIVNGPWDWPSVASCVPSYEKSEALNIEGWVSYYHRYRCKFLPHKCGFQNRQLSKL